MSKKSHVGLMQEQCRICLAIEDTGVLLDRRLRESLPHKTVIGFLKDNCKDCRARLEGGKRIALVPIDPEKSKEAEIIKTIVRPDGTSGLVVTGYKEAKVFRTGPLAFLLREAWERMFNVPCPQQDMAFIEQELYDLLTKRGDDNAAHDSEDDEPGKLTTPAQGRNAGGRNGQGTGGDRPG